MVGDRHPLMALDSNLAVGGRHARVVRFPAQDALPSALDYVLPLRRERVPELLVRAGHSRV